jgi:NTP pyrophosphatase (non-canonical NTP hydrolase)
MIFHDIQDFPFPTSVTDERGCATCHFNENGWCVEHSGGRQENYCNKHVHHLNALVARVHKSSKKWWIDLETGAPKNRNVGEMLMLTVSELAEALEGHRKNLPDEKLPHRSAFEVELADALIRLLDIAGGLKLDLGGAFEEKMAYNAVREDHKLEARRSVTGKKY